ncbi:MAG: Gfo/Idh/MocA family oxidoreductase [Candidatus Symbiothrix sp.]|jgi:UDP-N-acetyl-2-amino-2-deoxyglucuronate dehydrogenase|nr:Gfo/Idh/MocA family oxidoreductase [Candidatus Symbiothrix sp.]
MNPIKLALVGCGRISQRHIEAVAANDGIRIALVCDVDESKAKQTAARLSVPCLTDYRKIRGVDVISVLTPSGMHPRHVIDLAEQTDAQYIVCEKPVSLTLREACEMLERVEKAGKTLLPVYQNRYNPLIVFMKDLIAAGRLGKIHQFVCNVFWNRNDDYFKIDWHGTQAYDGGVFYTQASHYVDMIFYLFGKVKTAHGLGGTLRQLETPDSVSAICELENGAVGTLNATVSVYRSNYQTELTIIGEKGTVRLSGTNLNTIEFWDVENMSKPEMDFTLNHQYGKGHDTMYHYIVSRQWDKFPAKDDVLAGIRLMEKISF